MLTVITADLEFVLESSVLEPQLLELLCTPACIQTRYNRKSHAA